MSDTALPTSPLATFLSATATVIGDRLPAAFGLTAGEVQLARDAAAHPMPADAVAVRWELGEDDGVLAIAITPAAAAMLQQGPPEQDLVAALTGRIAHLMADLAPLFEGGTPALGEGTEVAADQALVDGPGDVVSVALSDRGTHMATIGLRMVVGDHLLSADADFGLDEDPMAPPVADSGPQGLPVDQPGPAAEGIGLPQQQPVAEQPSIPMPGSAPAAPATPMVVGAAPAGGRTRPAPPRQPEGEQHEAHPAQFASFDQLSALPGAAHSMAMLGEVEMGVTAELGRTRLTVRDVLGLNPGSIIELDRSAGSPVDVVVNGTLIARGEVVVIDEEFGIRITEIIGMNEADQPFGLQVAQ